MSKQVAIIGLGRFGTSLAVTLYDAGYEVLAIDKSADLVEGISSHVTHAVRMNATNEVPLRKLGVGNFDVGVVTIGASIQDSIMATILLKKLGVRYIVSRADSELHGEILSSIGADKVVFPEKDTAFRMGPLLTIRDASDFVPLGNGSGIIKIQAPDFFVGRTLNELGFGLASKSGAVVLMIQRGKEGIVNPNIEEVVSLVDVLIIAGNNADVEKLIEKSEKTVNNGSKKKGNGSS